MADQAEPERIHMLDEVGHDASQDPARLKPSLDQGGTAITITLDPELEAALTEQARRQGVAPEVVALEALRKRFLDPLQPRDEWERRVLGAAIDCGVSLPPEALTS